jgi:hypothetical protein
MAGNGATPVIPVLWLWKQEDHEFWASLGYIASPYFKKKRRKKKPESKKLNLCIAFMQLTTGSILHLKLVPFSLT